MKLILTPEAAARLDDQVSYQRENRSPAAAERLRHSVLAFLSDHLASFPRAGHYLEKPDLWESWIPGTRLVVWFRIEDDTVVVVTVWHTSQDRRGESSTD